MLVALVRFLSSLKLAVLVILSLIVALAVATFIESAQDTPSAKYWIYQAFWFQGLLFALGVNIFCVAMSRYPWKKRHFSFLVAHLGILTLLVGSWMTDRFGIDGNLRLVEGEASNVLELDTHYLSIHEHNELTTLRVPWIPPQVTFQPMVFRKKPSQQFSLQALTIDQYLSHADAKISFVAVPQLESEPKPPVLQPAVQFRLAGGPMRMQQDFWLWAGSPDWRQIQAGPAVFKIVAGRPGGVAAGAGPEDDASLLEQALVKAQGKANALETTGTAGTTGKSLAPPQQQPTGTYFVTSSGLEFQAQSSAGKRFQASTTRPLDPDHPLVLKPGWKGDVSVKVLQWIPHATLVADYTPAKVQWGAAAPESALHVSGKASGQPFSLWLGLGDRVALNTGRDSVEIGYLSRRLILPFRLRLDHFQLNYDPGTQAPASYSSEVAALLPDQEGELKALIQMNEPFNQGGFTFYQASYENGVPRPVTSILAVNYDPGRELKYIGSLLIVLGFISLFVTRYWAQKVTLATVAPKRATA